MLVPKLGYVLFLYVSFYARFVSGHYIFGTLITNSGTSTSAVRRPSENAPIKDITSPGATCNVGLTPATETVTVAAGSTVGFKANKKTFHPGPAAIYLGKAPRKAADWDGSGSRWFKIAEWGATFNPFVFTSYDKDTFTAKIPRSVPSGEYLVRIEQMGFHLPGSPEFFVSCAQIKITGGGSGNPSMVSIPGYIAKDDPMLVLNIYWPIPTSYTVPGPKVYSNGSSSPTPQPSRSSSSQKLQTKVTHAAPTHSPLASSNQTSHSFSCRRRRRQRKSTTRSVRHVSQLHRRLRLR